MQQVPLDHSLLNADLFTDVVCFLSSAPGAMFDAGTVRLITRTGTEYVFNYLRDDLKHADVAACFPPLSQCRFTAFGKGSVVPEGWHHLYLGLGTNMVIHDAVYPTFRRQIDALPTDTKLLSAWRQALRQTLTMV